MHAIEPITNVIIAKLAFPRHVIIHIIMCYNDFNKIFINIDLSLFYASMTSCLSSPLLSM